MFLSTSRLWIIFCFLKWYWMYYIIDTFSSTGQIYIIKGQMGHNVLLYLNKWVSFQMGGGFERVGRVTANTVNFNLGLNTYCFWNWLLVPLWSRSWQRHPIMRASCSESVNMLPMSLFWKYMTKQFAVRHFCWQMSLNDANLTEVISLHGMSCFIKDI